MLKKINNKLILRSQKIKTKEVEVELYGQLSAELTKYVLELQSELG